MATCKSSGYGGWPSRMQISLNSACTPVTTKFVDPNSKFLIWLLPANLNRNVFFSADAGVNRPSSSVSEWIVEVLPSPLVVWQRWRYQDKSVRPPENSDLAFRTTKLTQELGFGLAPEQFNMISARMFLGFLAYQLPSWLVKEIQRNESNRRKASKSE